MEAELVWIVVLRILTVATLVASIAVLATNQFTNFDGTKTTFKDVITYRFVLAIAGLGVLYSFCQVPFSTYHVHKEKRFFRNDWAPEFDFYCDKIMSWLLATSVGYEFKKALERFIQLEGSDGFLFFYRCYEGLIRVNFDFLDRAYVAVGLLFLGFLGLPIVSILSSLIMGHKSEGFFG